ncbi:hypothetical protein ACXIUS_20500 [Bosea thiooxidans]|jgi:hypothetical protein
MQHYIAGHLMRRDLRSGQDDQPDGLKILGFDYRCRFGGFQSGAKRPQIDGFSRFRMLQCHGEPSLFG